MALNHRKSSPYPGDHLYTVEFSYMSKKPENSPEGVDKGESVSGKKWEYVEQSEQQEAEAKAQFDNDVEIEPSDKDQYAEMSKEELIEALAKADKKTQENWDHFVRTKAEMQNVLNGAAKEKQNIRNYALKSFVQELLSVLDNFERTQQAVAEAVDTKSMSEGIELTQKSLMATLEKFGVESVNPLNEKFDPQFHEAMSMQPSADHEPNTVITVLQKGYLLNDRLIRPAMVIVSAAT